MPPTPVPTAASACPSRPRTFVAAHLASMAPPAGRTSMSVARTLDCAATEALATTRLAPTAVPAVPPTPAPTASCPMCPAAPHPARMGAPAAPRGTPPTSVPACQVGPALLHTSLLPGCTHLCLFCHCKARGIQEKGAQCGGTQGSWRSPGRKLREGQPQRARQVKLCRGNPHVV